MELIGAGMAFVPKVSGQVSAVELDGQRFDLSEPYAVEAGAEYVALVVAGVAQVMPKQEFLLLIGGDDDDDDPPIIN